MSIHDIDVRTIDGRDTTLGEFAGKSVLVVNVASKCGLTPQYEGLVHLQERFADRGFTVVGFPCNQFAGQEPGGREEILSCAMGFGADFPIFEKIEVNGPGRHPLYDELTSAPDEEGNAGDVVWNFEKFLLTPDGEVAKRFRPLVEPESDELVSAIESLLSDASTAEQTTQDPRRG